MNSCRLLAVDDDPMALRLIQRMLAGQPWQVDLAHHASEALPLAAARAHDVVLIDISLPQVGGAELARRLRALPGPATRQLIACTAHRDFASSPDHPLFDAVLIKPFVRASLLETLEAVSRSALSSINKT